MSELFVTPEGDVCRVPESGRSFTFSKRDHALIRAYIFARDGFQCCRCGWRPNLDALPEIYDGRRAINGFLPDGRYIHLQVDHVRPRIRGGSNHPNNLQTLCCLCNAGKCDREVRYV